MKGPLLIALIGMLILPAQAQMTSEDFFDRLTSNAVILSDEGLIRGADTKGFLSGFEKVNGKSTYKKVFTKEVKAKLEYEIGELETVKGVYSVMFIKQPGTSSYTIELLAIYAKKDTSSKQTVIDEARKNWMALCNAHQAAELVKQLYTSNAWYYNRGRLLQGTEAISQEYQYMNSATYSLKLTPLHLEWVTPGIAYEIGQCSGSYPLPYMLLWEKQTNGNWKVLMDSNY